MGIFARLESWVHMLLNNPLDFVLFALYTAAAILPALILHECAHGYVAYRCGDPTAKMLGRLSLNPAKHLDPIGTICMVLLGFGWAKPVPVNPRNFRNYRRDDTLVSIAGVVTNFALFFVSCALSVFLGLLLWKPEAIAAYGGYTLHAFMSSSTLSRETLVRYTYLMRMPWLMYVLWFLDMFATVNLCLAVFNLLPLPPLDGFHLVNNLLLRNRIFMDQKFHDIARFVLLILCVSGLLGRLLGTVNGWIYNLFVKLFLLLTGMGG